MTRCTLLGLTGGVGMGKSVAAGFLREFGLPVIDTDQLARELVQPGQPALAEIREAFGPGVIAPDGHLRREVLADIVFADEGRRRRLEQILHPRIRVAWQERVRAWQMVLESSHEPERGRPRPRHSLSLSPSQVAGGAPTTPEREPAGVCAARTDGGRDAAVPEVGAGVGVVVIPLLYETGAETEFTATICVACSAGSQAERLAARGWSAEQAQRRVSAQLPTEQKMALADFVVWAEGGVDLTRQQLMRILSGPQPPRGS